jgi:predicted RNase H-like HicB family nuclease
MKTYIAYVYKDTDSSFGVSFPDLPGCYGAGESYDEAIENAKISLREYALAVDEDGGEMPEPRTHGALAADAAEAIEMKKAAFVIAVPLITAGAKRRVNISLDGAVLAAIDRGCELAGINRSAMLAEAAREWLEDRMGAVFAAVEGTRAKPAKGRRKNKAVPAIP